MHAKSIISIWLSPSQICFIDNSYNAKMTIRDQTQNFPLCYSNSNTCQKPTPTICILSLCNGKCKWKQLIITITSHSNKQSPFIFSIQICPINTKNWSTVNKPFNRWSEWPKNTLKNFFIRVVSRNHFGIHNASRIWLL